MPFKQDSTAGGAATRATKLTEVSSFKLYAYNSSGTAIADGVTYTKSGSSWTTTSKVFWPQTGNVTFYAFSPASNSSVSFNTTSKTLTYTAPTAQGSQQDVLYAYKTSARPTNNTVDLTFNHANAAFSVSAQLATGCTATVNVSGVKLVNVMPTNTLTVSSGAASASGSSISTDVAINSTTLTTTAATISSSPLMLPPQSVTAWSGTSALANTYLAVTCKVQANDSYVVGSADATGTVYVPMDKTLNKGEDNTVNLVFGSEIDNGRSYGRDENGNRITVSNYNGEMNAVDLGLSVLWGDNDLQNGMYYPWGWVTTDYGADKMSDYQWRYWPDGDDNGEPDSQYFDFTWEHTPFYIGKADGSNKNEASSWSKYTTFGQTLDLNNDIAHQLLGGKWRMPTEAEWQELIDNCKWESYSNPENGFARRYYVYGKKEGYTDNEILFLADGYIEGLTLKDYSWIDDSDVHDDGSTLYELKDGNSYYWTSTMSSSPSQARGVKSKSIGNYDRKLGFKIRPVCDK